MNTEVLSARDAASIEKAIQCAAALIQAGQLVAFPTETVYGLGANAFNADAIARVFEAKGRPADNPLIVHVATIDEIQRCAEVTPDAVKLAHHFMPGPLTLVLPAKMEVPLIARGGLYTVAIRIPRNAVALALIQAAGALVAPSANRSGRPSPTSAAHVLQDLAGRIAAVLDGGECGIGIESTVLDLTSANPTILRPGAIEAEALSEVLGSKVYSSTGGNDERKSPGTRYRHYAPQAKVVASLDGDAVPVLFEGPSILVLTLPQHMELFPGVEIRPLTEHSYYAELRRADELGVAEIFVYTEPGDIGLGLRDRIMRSAT